MIKKELNTLKVTENRYFETFSGKDFKMFNLYGDASNLMYELQAY